MGQCREEHGSPKVRVQRSLTRVLSSRESLSGARVCISSRFLHDADALDLESNFEMYRLRTF